MVVNVHCFKLVWAGMIFFLQSQVTNTVCEYSTRQHWALMGSWAPRMGLIPASHFPIPFSVTFSANKPLCPQILVSEQASRDPNPRHGEHSKAPPQALAQHH